MSIKTVVTQWYSSKSSVIITYGHISNWDVSNVTDMSRLFEYSYRFNDDISNWDVSNVTNMTAMFSHNTSSITPIFNQDISSWDVSKVTNMSGLFSNNKEFNQDISSWDVSNVTNMYQMFHGAEKFNQNINSWNTSKVTHMTFMFRDAINFNQPIGSWDVSKVTDMSQMFLNAQDFNQDISSWDVSNVTNMSFMFGQTPKFNQPIGSWDVSKVTNMSHMFQETEKFNQPLDSWDVSNVTSMSKMFEDAVDFNQPIDSWNVSKVIHMDSMFERASKFNQPLASWDVSSVTRTNLMFSQAIVFNQDIGCWDTSEVTNMTSMFLQATNFNQPVGTWDVSNVSVGGLNNMFHTAANFNQDLSSWCVSHIASEPSGFSLQSPSNASNEPIWGTCPSVTTVTTNNISNIDLVSADFSGKIISNGGEEVTERGIVYATTATNANPEIGGTGVTKDDNGAGAGVFTETISGLTANTGYSYRAYATTATGTTYGAVQTFTTLTAVTASNSLNFDGANDYVDIGQVIPSNSSYTKEAWVYLETISQARNVISSLNAPFWINQGVLSSGNNFQGGGAAVNITSPNTLAINTWIHVAITYDGSTLKLYEDGVLVAEQSGAPAYTAENMLIGTFVPGALSLDGNIDEVRIWNTARTCAEIFAYKNIELAGTETGLIAYYDFNQGTLNTDNTAVATLLDKQINGTLHNGTLTNFTLTGATSNWVDGSVNGVITGSPAMFPEINIVGNSVNIVNGDTTPDFADDTDFGDVSIATDDTHTFTIQNTGTADLTGITIGKSGVHEGEFVIAGAPTTVTAGQSATFTVTFAPANTGLRTVDVVINSNDYDEAAYTIKLQGTGTSAPQEAALHFDGANDYVDATASVATALPVGNAARSVEFTVKTGQTSLGNIVSWGTQAGNGERSSFAVRDGKVGFVGAFKDVTGSVTINDNTEHNIAITYDGSDLTGFKFYVDGVLDPGPYTFNQNNSGSTINTLGQNLILGKNASPSNIEYYNGILENVRIWNKELSAAEVSSYAGQTIPTSTANLVAYFNFNEGTPNADNTGLTTVTDLKGNYNGTLTNFAKNGTTSNWVNGVVDATAPTFTSATAVDFTENASGVAYTIAATDDGAITYSLGSGNDEASFTLNGAEVSFNTSPDFETKASYTINVIATDALSNSANQDVVITILDEDEVPPTVVISSSITGPTDTNPIPVIITFSETVTGFDASDINVSGGTIQNFAGSDAVYSFNFAPSGNGTLTVDIAADIAQDGAGNNNTVASQFSIEYSSLTPITQQNIYAAVALWESNPTFAEATYRHISNWDVSAVTDMNALFLNKVTFNDDISGWDVSNVTNMASMFFGATNFNQAIGSWNVSKVTNMNGLFQGSTNFNQDIGSWNVSNVENMSSMFYEAVSFNQAIGSWNVSKVENMAAMFWIATNFNQDISSWNVSSVLDTSIMFWNAINFNQDIGSWNVSQVTTMNAMFSGASNFNQDISSWDVSQVTNMNAMFWSATNFNQNIRSWCVPLIVVEPSTFSTSSGLHNFFKPVWGRCPNAIAVSTASAASITLSSAVLSGSITDLGSNAISEKGIMLSDVNQNPTIPGAATVKFTDITPGAGINITRTDFTPESTIYFRTYVIDVYNVTYYGNVQSFTTSSHIAPGLTTSAATGVTLTNAVLEGIITTSGTRTISEKGILLSSINTSPILDGADVEKNTDSGSGTKIRTIKTDLTKGTTYYFRAFIKVSDGTTFYGDVSTFTTLNSTVATVLTTAVSNVVLNSATFAGNVTEDGDASGGVSERGIIYATSNTNANPEINGTGVNKVSIGSGTGVFSQSVAGLNSGTEYSYRAYAINSVGTSYGNIFKFSTTSAELETTDASNITTTSAMFAGKVLNAGGNTFTEKGVVYSISGINNNPFIDGTGVEKKELTFESEDYFIGTSIGLNSNTEYAYKTYAISSSGITYGDLKTFTTQSTYLDKRIGYWDFEGGSTSDSAGNFGDLITNGSTISNGKLDLNAGSNVRTSNYTGSDITSKTLVSFAEIEDLDVRTGSILSIQSFETGHNFDAIVYSEQEVKKWMPGSEGYFRTVNPTPGFEESNVNIPVMMVITYAETPNRKTLITIYRNGTEIGQYLTTDIITYSTASLDADSNTDVEIMFGSRHSIPNNRNFAVGSVDALVDEAMIFNRTLSPAEINALYVGAVEKATVITTAASSISVMSVVLGGNVISDGRANVTERGIIYSESNANSLPEIDGNEVTKVISSNGIGVFSETVSNLSGGTEYAFRTYAINSQGTSYGDVLTFTTSNLSTPTVTTNTVTSVTSTEALFSADVTDNGGADIEDLGVLLAETSVNSNPVVTDTNIIKVGTEDVTTFSETIKNLKPNTQYTYKAYADNDTEFGYGTALTFTTSATTGSVVTSVATDIQETSALFSGEATDNGGSAITETGIVYAVTATNANPEVGGTGVIKDDNGSAIGTFSETISGLSNGTQYSYRAYIIN